MNRRAIATTMQIPADGAETLDLQIWPVLHQWKHLGSSDLMELARSCYLQGLIDGSSPAVVAALAQLKQVEEIHNGRH